MVGSQFIFFFKEIDIFPKGLTSMRPSQNSKRHFSHLFQNLAWFRFIHSNRCTVLFHCHFNSYFPNDWECVASFHVLIFYLYILFHKMSEYFANFNCCFVLVFLSSLSRLESLGMYTISKYFLPTRILSFHSLCFFGQHEFYSQWRPICQLLFLWIMLLVPYLRNWCLLIDCKGLLCFLIEVLQFTFYS